MACSENALETLRSDCFPLARSISTKQRATVIEKVVLNYSPYPLIPQPSTTMPATRTFDFSVSTLLRDSKRLHAALVDTITGPAVARRLSKKNPVADQPDIVFAPLFDAQIQLVENGGIAQSGAFGEIGEMTQEQVEAFIELERLISGARRSAHLAFPKNDARLHSEFQVGIHEPSDFPSEIERAGKVLAACQTHADALDDHGWIDEDTDALDATIDLLDGGDTEHEAAKDKKKGFTQGRNLAANNLYKMCLSTQNAARLAYPANKAAKDEAILVARNRFLLDEFPPRGAATAGDKPATTAPVQ
jgi:hypothetical protein